MEFDIHNVKDVREAFNEKDAQKLLSSGWVLLAVCPINNGETSDRCYVFGTDDLDYTDEPTDPEVEERRKKFFGMLDEMQGKK